MKTRSTPSTTKATDLLDSANDGAKAVGALHIGFLAFLAYVGSIVWSTTHVDLLRNAPVQLPILQVKLSLVGFFQYVPWLVVLLHFNLLIQLYLLSRKLWLLDRASQSSSAATHLKQRLFTFPFAHYLVASEKTIAIRLLLGATVGISVIALPLFILVYAQLTFLPFHDEGATWWMRIAVWTDSLLLLLLWPLLSSPTNRWRDWWNLPRFRIARRLLPSTIRKEVAPHMGYHPNRPRNGFLLLLATASASLLSLAALVPSGAMKPLTMAEYASIDHEVRCDVEAVPSIVEELKLHSAREELIQKHCEWEPAFSLEGWFVSILPPFMLSTANRASDPTYQTLKLTAWLFDDDAAPWRRNLSLRNERLVSEQTPSDVMVELGALSLSYIKSKTLERTLGLSLRGRDLRRADLTGAVLIAADLREAQLQDARLDNAFLIGADLRHSHLQRAVGRSVFLTGANLSSAWLQGVFFSEARLEKADLSYARLQLATLTNAHLEGANLGSTKADFVNLAGAHLQATYFPGASMRGADLHSADLRGAIVGVSDLQTTNFTEAKLQSADLENTSAYCARFSGRLHGCALLRLTEGTLDKEELRALTLKALPYARNAMEASGLQMGAEQAFDKCSTIPYQSHASRTCNVTDIRSSASNARWFDDKKAYRKHALTFLIGLACEDEAVAFGIARNFREMWQEDSPKAAKALLSRIGKCGGLKDPSEQFIRSLEDEIRKGS